MKSILAASLFGATVAIAGYFTTGNSAFAAPQLDGGLARADTNSNLQHAKLKKDFCCRFRFLNGTTRKITAQNRLPVATACVGLIVIAPGTQVSVTSGSC